MKRNEIPWAKIRREYERGEGTTKELALKYGLSPFTVRNRCTKEKWPGGRNDVEQKFDNALEKYIDKKAMSVADRAAAFHERHLQEGEEMLDLLRDKIRPHLQHNDMDSIKKYFDTWIRLAENLHNAYGLNDEKPKPVFHVGLMQNLVEIKLPPGYDPHAIIDVPPPNPEPPESEPEHLPPGDEKAAD